MPNYSGYLEKVNRKGDFIIGYESRLYIVKENKAVNYAEIIARFDCSKMGYGNGWREIF